ncbi:MAG: GNAT family N-acetyltransferase [Bacillota bacterium]|jgi:ribosomal protein S18 acetylase RimI-like enzyme
MITCKQVDQTYLPQYDQIPMIVQVNAYYRIEKANRGLGGFSLVETPVKPYVKDFCADDDAGMAGLPDQWDLANWAFFMAFAGNQPIGGAAVASRTKGVRMLSGRDDLAVLWDIRVVEDYKHRGVGQALFDMAKAWSRAQGLVQMKIECQNDNIPAIKFYHKQGAVLSAIDEYAYYNEPKYRHEVQLIWYLEL